MMRTATKNLATLYIVIISAFISAQSTFAQDQTRIIIHNDKAKKKSEGFDLFEKIKSKGIFQWVPKADLEHPLPAACHPKTLEQNLTHTSNSTQFYQVAATHFKNCAKTISDSQPKSLGALLKVASNKYDGYTQKKVKKVEIHIKDKGTSFGYLAIKDDRPRPFIIFKCGIFCEGDFSSGNRMIFMHLFDEAPFNVLMLGSQTGLNNLQRNKRLAFGGFFEGQELFDIAKWLRTESPYSHLISDMHIFGMSLGGNAALFSALYNSVQNYQRSQNIIDSAIAYCPAVDMKNSIENVFNNPILRQGIGAATWNSLRKVHSEIPEVKELIPNMYSKPNFKQYPFIIGESTRGYLENRFFSQFLIPFTGVKFRQLPTYWDYTNFLNFATMLETNTLVVAAKNDPIVKNSINSTKLSKINNNHVNVINLDYGSHCGNSITYGWQNMSTLFKNYFIKNSPNFKRQYTVKTQRMKLPQAFYNFGPIQMDQAWTMQAQKDYAELEYRNFDRTVYNPACNSDMSNPYGHNKACYKKIKKKVPLKDFPFNIHIPQTDTEAEALTRWMNSNVEILGRDKQLLVNTRNHGWYIRWREIEDI